ncbi:MAG TPA: ferredoxin reductase family protein [Candidatus Saccharimonadales bacterium]|nr:ferredoxin reductase family protein [Candidatus Saccharimonadales bacterium]
MARSSTIKKQLAWAFWALNGAVITGFWVSGATGELASGDIVAVGHALARLFGLLATFCALTQFVLMGRAGWLEPIFGLDRLAIFHRRNGIAVLALILLHSSLMVITRTLLTGGVLPEGAQQVLGLPYVWLAVIAEILFIATAVTSIVMVVARLRFELWYAVHMLNYAAIILVPFHQFANGSDFLINPTFAIYWMALYVFTAVNMLVWRFGRPLWLFWWHHFTVQKVVAETPTANSVYISGKNLQRFTAKGGQFVMVRFLDKHRFWQEHPFSLSALPSSDHIRLTVRALGDFTNGIPSLAPGTPVVVSGPHGAFTHEKQVKSKVAYIAGGIGITPLRAMIEERAEAGGKNSAVLLYGNRTAADTALLSELTQFGERIQMPIYTVLSEEKSKEQGYIDKERIARLVPDIAERDVFLCGPPPMMAGVKQALKELGVPDGQVHYERFSLHKK